MAQRRIGILGFDRLQALDLTGPADVFRSDALAAPEFCDDGVPPYEVVVIGLDGRQFVTSSGVRVMARFTVPTRTALDTLIIPGGAGLRESGMADRAARWIESRAPHIRRIATVCTGIYALAPTGLLDDRNVTTHWGYVTDVQRRFPKLRVDPDAIYRKDGRFYTSAGVTAGIDLSLALVEEDLGPEAALAIAREMVVYLKRAGGQNQFSEPLRFQLDSTDRFADVASWIPTHLRGDLSVEVLARRACLSVRQFSRAFKERFGITPAAYVEQARLSEACRRLAARRTNVETVARSVGYASDDAFRRAFERRFGVSPRQYRSRFNVAGETFAQ
ncbi:MAG TPA: helix-turn-helix domain-containing protein [Gemmatimonadaceae bacterium]|nr:helix-turn-helix domain-containing protein [Gemmatimonadaceae bacterium]